MTSFLSTWRNMKQIIIKNGYPRSGKTSFSEYLSEISQEKVFDYSFVTDIKRIADSIGCDGGKTAKGRKFLSDLADIAEEYNNYCSNSIINACNTIDYVLGDYIFCVDVRRPKDIHNLYHRLKENYNVLTLFIDRPSVSDNKQSNTADSEVKAYDYDVTIDNSMDLLWYKRNITNFYADLIGGKFEK